MAQEINLGGQELSDLENLLNDYLETHELGVYFDRVAAGGQGGQDLETQQHTQVASSVAGQVGSSQTVPTEKQEQPQFELKEDTMEEQV